MGMILIDEKIQKIEKTLADNPGVTSLTVDGTNVKWDRGQLAAELDRLRRTRAEQAGTRRRATTVAMRCFP